MLFALFVLFVLFVLLCCLIRLCLRCSSYYIFCGINRSCFIFGKGSSFNCFRNSCWNNCRYFFFFTARAIWFKYTNKTRFFSSSCKIINWEISTIWISFSYFWICWESLYFNTVPIIFWIFFTNRASCASISTSLLSKNSSN